MEIALRDYARAVYVLVQAGKLAPDRPEVPLALANAAQAGGYYGDAAVAYDRYLHLQPDDDTARRDRALACGFTDARQAEGLNELRSYIGRHPQDALGHYYMAQLTWRDDPAAALRELEATLRLDPKFAAAHVDAGWLMNRQGKTAEAMPHFEKAIALNPRDARALDQLGQRIFPGTVLLNPKKFYAKLLRYCRPIPNHDALRARVNRTRSGRGRPGTPGKVPSNAPGKGPGALAPAGLD